MAKYYYNGVRLPEIPADVLASYPYCWIRHNVSGAYYDLMMSESPWWKDSSTTIYTNGYTKGVQMYKATNADGAWAFTQSWTSSGGFGNDTSRIIMWSNHDIPNGSATATDIYFFGTENVPENSPDQRMEYLQATGKQYFNTGIVPDATTEVEIKYSVQKILTYGSHMLSSAGWYTPFPRNYSGLSFLANRLGTEKTINLTPNVNTEYTVKAFPGDKVIINDIEYGTVLRGSSVPSKPLYMFTYGGSPSDTSYTGTSRVYYCKIWQNGALVRNFTPMWKSGTVGMYDEVGKVFYTSEGTEAFLAGPMLGATNESKYLVRSGSTLYTITDGALSALTETEVTASLFQTYGEDEIPDGALLATLTDPEVLFWQGSEEELPALTMTVTGAPPLPQVITSGSIDLTHASITGIDHAAVDASADVRFAISFDDGASWKAFDGSAWFHVSDTAPGMLASTVNAITAEQWAEVATLTSCLVRACIPAVTSYVGSVVLHYINP